MSLEKSIQRKMIGGYKMNKVTISARTREASKMLKEAIEQSFGFELKGLQHPVEFATDLDADVVIQILKSFIRNERMDSLSFHYEGDTEKEEKQPEILEVPTEVQEEEDDDDGTYLFVDKEISQLSRKQQVLRLFQRKEQWENKEIKETLGLTEANVWHILNELQKEGQIEKVSRGVWKKVVIEELKEQPMCMGTAVKQSIMSFLGNMVQEVSIFYLKEVTKFSERAIEKALAELKEEGLVVQTQKGMWRPSHLSYPYSDIYEKEEYHLILDEIMSSEYFKGERLKKMFSEELVNQLLQELVESDCIKKVEEDKYLVYLESRMIYFLSKHPGANVSMMKSNMPLEKERDIVANIKYLLSNNVVERRGKHRGYVLLSK